MAEHDDSKEKYGTPKPYKGDLGNNGYPNNIPNTQTQKTRGTGAATKGTNHSAKMG
jgi:hypothetical protein